MQSLKSSKPYKKWIIIGGSIIGAVSLMLLLVYVIHATNLSRAIKSLDIEEESTVVRVMKYGGRDADTVLAVAHKYYDAGMYTDSARLSMYALCYLECKEALPLLQDALEKNGADAVYISQFEKEIPLSDFETVSFCENDGYGIADGIYCEFLGYCKAKISSCLPLDIYATTSGAVFLDSSDRLVKSISRDGSKLNLETTERVSEFVYFESHIYYIDEKGQPHGPEVYSLAEGEYVKNLYIEGSRVVCTVYGADGESLRTLVLNSID